MDFLQKRELILHGDLKKVIMSLALPIMMTNFIQTIYNLTDTYFVSQIGGNEVAAIQLVWSIIFMMMSFGLGIQVSGSSMISQYIGSGQIDEAKKVAGQMIVFLLSLSVVIGVIGYYLAPSIVHWMGATGSMKENATTFLKIMLASMPTIYLMFIFNGIKQGQGDTVSPMVIGGLSVVCNIILDPIFIFGFGMGIEGAAYATVLSRGIFGIVALLMLFSKNRDFSVDIKDLKVRIEIIKKLFKVGFPAAFGQATASLGFTIMSVFIMSYGETVLTAFAIGNKITSLIMMPAMGIGSALSSIVGQNLGADNISRARESVRTSIKLSTLILVIGGIIMLPFVEEMLGFFTNNQEVIEIGEAYVKAILYSIPLMGIFQIWNGTFQGAGHTLLSMGISMGRLWFIRIPLLLVLINFTTLGPEMIWYAMVFSNVVICFIGYLIYRSHIWEKRIIKDEKVIV